MISLDMMAKEYILEKLKHDMEIISSKYRFSSGPFAEMIFKIIDLQKNKINILLGNLKTTIKKNDFLFNPL